MEAAYAIELLAGFQIALGHADDFADRPANRCDCRIIVYDRASDGGSYLQVRQMEWRVEDIERAVADFVISQLGFLQRILFVNDDEGARVRRRAQRVVHQTSTQHLFGRQQVGDFANVSALGTVHSTFAGLKAGRVGKNVVSMESFVESANDVTFLAS